MSQSSTQIKTCQNICEFRSLVDNIHDPIYRFDSNCKQTYVNPVVEKLCNQPASALLGKTPIESSLVAPQESIAMMRSLQRVMQTGKVDTVDISFAQTDGSYRYYQHVHMPEFSHDGAVRSVLAIGRDISDFKHVQQALLTSEQTFRTLAENSPDSIVRYDKSLKRTYVNAAWERANAIFRDDILGKRPTEQAGRIQENVQEFEAMLRRVLETGKSEAFELKWENKDGKLYFFNFHTVAEYDGEGNIISVLTISRDITSYKELEHALSSKEQLFRALAENSPDLIIRYDTSCRKVYVNAMAAKTFGRATSELLGGTPTETALLVNYQEFELKLQEVIHTKQETMIEISSHYTGEQVWAEVRLIPEFNTLGELMSVLAVGRYITERKKLEIHLNATLSQFEQFINNIPEMAWIKDKEGKYIIVNQVLANRFGVGVKDMIGKTDLDFFDEQTSKAHREADIKVMLEGITFKVEEMFLSDEDQKEWIESIKNPFRDCNAEIIGTIGTARNITERKQIEKQMAFMAHHDALTHLPNRTLAKDRAEQAIVNAKRNESKVAFLFIDLDKFKDINDSLGHLAGDTLLKLIASRLRSCIRETDTLSRQGGDEFLIILSNMNESTDVLLLINKIFKSLEEPFKLGSHTLFTSVSIGVSLYPDDGVTFNRLYQRADIAMYQAKGLGRNTYAFHSSHISSEMLDQLKLQNDLRMAIKNNELILYYQPQIDLQTHRIIGVEALLRWIHPERGLISPLTFIPLAESSGLIVEIGEWVLMEACKQASLWHQNNINITMAVNLSAIQFKRGNIEEIVQKALDYSGLSPQFLELELTESIFIHNTQEILKTIYNLKELGILLSIDDFGTGYSSLTYLKRFKVDKLKIDRSFIHNLLHNQEDAVIVKTIIEMAKSLKLKTIAEGVETKDVLEAVQSYGCHEVQGYYFSKPLEAHYIASRIDKTMKWLR